MAEDVVGNLDLIVTTDIEMTDTARYSDYVLPASFWLEYPDIRGNFSNPYLVYGGKAIEPLWECKNDSEITTLIAHGLGYEEHYPYFTDEEWIDIGLDSDENRARGIDHATLKEKKAIRQLGTEEEPWMVGGFEYDNEFPTPSGRAEFTVRYLRPATNTVKIGKAKPKSSSSLSGCLRSRTGLVPRFDRNIRWDICSFISAGVLILNGLRVRRCGRSTRSPSSISPAPMRITAALPAAMWWKCSMIEAAA
ncbi:MAG: molybdopterin-dependent oxidoreductase [Adlercreutzia equolifaciens]